MTRYRRIVWTLIVLNIIALIAGTGIYLRYNKLHKDDNRFIKESQEYSNAVAKRDGIPQETVLNSQLLEHHIIRDGHISDADLDEMIRTIESSFSKNRSGSSLLSYGFGFLYMKSAPPTQKAKVGNLCVDVLTNATNNENRMYALRVISLSHIVSTRPQLAPFANDPNPEIAEKARSLIARFDKSNNKQNK